MNSDKFIEYFAKIEAFLNLTQRHDDSFTHKVNSSNNKAVQNFANELKFYARLRNAIVHNPKQDNKAIAEPHKSTVERLIYIHDQITQPKTLSSRQFHFDVLGAKETDYINNILVQMKEHSFSQFPVLDNNNKVVELINTNTIARWLSDKIIEKGEALILEATVADFIEAIEYPHNYRFIARNASIYDARGYFMDEINERGKNLDVLFITHSGKSTESILGLVTVEDVAGVG